MRDRAKPKESTKPAAAPAGYAQHRKGDGQHDAGQHPPPRGPGAGYAAQHPAQQLRARGAGTVTPMIRRQQGHATAAARKHPACAGVPQPPGAALSPQPPEAALRPQPPGAALRPQPPKAALRHRTGSVAAWVRVPAGASSTTRPASSTRMRSAKPRASRNVVQAPGSPCRVVRRDAHCRTSASLASGSSAETGSSPISTGRPLYSARAIGGALLLPAGQGAGLGAQLVGKADLVEHRADVRQLVPRGARPGRAGCAGRSRGPAGPCNTLWNTLRGRTRAAACGTSAAWLAKRR